MFFPQLCFFLVSYVNAQTWRSELYPINWTLGFQNSGGAGLQEYSYAGYHMGEDPIPASVPGNTYIVTEYQYNADNTGVIDVTAAIQQAINDAGNAGGGVVYLPAGTHKITAGINRLLSSPK